MRNINLCGTKARLSCGFCLVFFVTYCLVDSWCRELRFQLQVQGIKMVGRCICNFKTIHPCCTFG
jgi:hypothetical protein